MRNDHVVLAEEHGVIEDWLTLSILKTTGGYVIGAHVPATGERFIALDGQRMASANAYERLAANNFVCKNGVDAVTD